MIGRLFALMLFSLIFPVHGSIMAQAPSEKTLTIVGLGDSTTAGTPGFLSPREAPPEGRGNIESQYAYWLEKSHPEWKVLNRGVRGQRTDQMLKRFEYDVLNNRPGVVVILGGVNDIYQGYDTAHVKANLEKIYAKGLENGLRVMACTILPVSSASSEVNQRIAEVNRWIREYAEEKGLIFCDTHEALHDAERPGKLLGSPDDIHPDVAGYKKMAEVIARALEEEFRTTKEPAQK